MEKKDARGNIRFGIVLGVLAVLMLALTFGWAVFYLAAAHG